MRQPWKRGRDFHLRKVMGIHPPSSENKIRNGTSIDSDLCALNGLPENRGRLLYESKNLFLYGWFRENGLYRNKDRGNGSRGQNKHFGSNGGIKKKHFL